ncbi:MAG: hypothetical protein AAF196_07085 [Planctomycetota bacterium]
MITNSMLRRFRPLRRLGSTPALAAASLLLIGSSLHADEVRLQDGRVFYGKVTERQTTLLIETATGREVVRKDEVLRRRDDDSLRSELAELSSLANTRPEAWLEVARRAHQFRLTDEMWSALESAKSADQSDRLRARRHAFLSTLESEFLPAHYLDRDAEDRIRQLTLRVRKHRTPTELEALSAILSTFTDSSDQLWHKVRIATNALQREVLLDALWAMSAAGEDETSQENRHFVYRRAMFERNTPVRTSVLNNLRELDGGDEAVDYIASALYHSRLDVRFKSADTLGAIGTPSAAKALIAAAPKAAAGANQRAPRAHIAIVRQQAFIQDFDVEVAQAAAVANPVVGTLQSGVVLDVGIVGSFTIRSQLVTSYRRALHRIAGSDPGPDVAAWESWWQGIEEARRRAVQQATQAANARGRTEGEGSIWDR